MLVPAYRVCERVDIFEFRMLDAERGCPIWTGFQLLRRFTAIIAAIAPIEKSTSPNSGPGTFVGSVGDGTGTGRAVGVGAWLADG